jgi:hypothetical protein
MYAWALRAPLGGVSAQAPRAYAGPHGAAGDHHAPHLQVGLEPPVDTVLRVTDMVSVLRFLAADRASLGHEAPSDLE